MMRIVITRDEFNEMYCHAKIIHRQTILSTSFFYLIFPIKELFIDYERLHALGLDEQMSIRIEFTINFADISGIIQIQNIYSYNLSSESVGDLALSWLLKLRLSEYLKKISFDMCQEVVFKSFSINEVVKNTQCTHVHARFALERMKWDVNDAVICLMDSQLNFENIGTNSSLWDEKEVSDPTEEVLVHPDLEKLEKLFPVDRRTLQAIFKSTNCSFNETHNILLSNFSNHISHMPTSVEYPESSPNSVAAIIRESNHYSLYPIDDSYPNKFMILFLLIEGEILTCGSRCLICNNNLTYPGILPAVCGGSLCIMGYEELGVGIDLQREFIKYPLIMDLFISFLYSAAMSSKQRLDLMFPSSIRVYGSDQMEYSFLMKTRDGELTNNYPALQHVVDLIPSVFQMAEWSHHGELKDHLNSIHPLIYPLLLWLVRSNRSYLRLLDPVEVPGVLAKLCILSQ